MQTLFIYPPRIPEREPDENHPDVIARAVPARSNLQQMDDWHKESKGHYLESWRLLRRV